MIVVSDTSAVSNLVQIRAEHLLQDLYGQVLIDEKVGRQVARREDLELLGLGGVLLMAKEQGLIPEIGSHLDQLERHAGFYLGQQVKTELLLRAGETIPRSDPSS